MVERRLPHLCRDRRFRRGSGLNQFVQLFVGQPLFVAVAGIAETLRQFPPMHPVGSFPPGMRGLDDIHVIQLHSVARFILPRATPRAVFSPGRMPMYSTAHPGATASARSTSRILGILGTKISPPCICSIASITKRTPCSRVSQKRVMRGSVMVILPRLRCSMNTGMTLPRLPTTFPYLAQLNRVSCAPA